MKKWDWKDVINKDPSKRGVSVAAFEHVPLGPEWHKLFPLGVIGEYVYKGTVVRGSAEQPRRKAKYWFVKTVDTCGYYVQIEYLGYTDEHSDKLTEGRRWVMYTDLKPICTYTDNPVCDINPPIDTAQPVKETLDFIYAQMVGKLGVPTLADKFLGHKLNSELKIGDKVEVREKSNVNQLVIGFVGKILGRRVSVMYWDTSGETRKQSDSFWCHGSTENVHPLGWGAAAGVPNAPPLGPDDTPLAPEELGVDLHSPAIDTIKEDAYFEMVNPLDYNKIVAAKVTRVLEYGFFLCEIVSDIHQDSFDKYSGGHNQFHLHITSSLIMACGTAHQHGASILPPKDGLMRAFDWERYLTANCAEALQVPDKADNERYDHFQKGLRVEAVDHVKPSLICPAVIVQVIRPHLLKVRYLGWSAEYDQWKPINCPEVYPTGWCSLVGYPLTEPGASTVNFENDATFDFVPPPLPEVPAPTPKPPKPKNRKVSAFKHRRSFPRQDEPYVHSELDDEEELSMFVGRVGVGATKRSAETSPLLRRKMIKSGVDDADYKPPSSSRMPKLEPAPEFASDSKKEAATPTRPPPCLKPGKVADSGDRTIFSNKIYKKRVPPIISLKPKPMEATSKANGSFQTGKMVTAAPPAADSQPHSTDAPNTPSTSSSLPSLPDKLPRRNRKNTTFFGENISHKGMQFT